MVPTRPLGSIECPVRRLDELVDARVRLVRHGDPDRNADAANPVSPQVQVAHRGPDALAHFQRHTRVRVAQQDHELLPAEPGRDVVLADGRDDRPGHRPQDQVAGGVAIRVVEDLELVDIHHQDADRIPGTAPLGHQAHVLVEVAAIGQAGQRIGRRLDLHGPMRVGPGQGG